MDAMTHTRSLPDVDRDRCLESTLLDRRSTKRFADRRLTLDEAAGALWSVAGTTEDGRRVCPSARASYPVTASLVAAEVEGLDTGVYAYDPARHAVDTVQTGDHRRRVAEVTLDAVDWLATCPAAIVLSADMVAAGERFPDQPAEHGEVFVWIEVGHAAQNLYLWAAEHRLGTALIAGLDDARAAAYCTDLLPHAHRVLGILPIGQPAT